MAPCFASAVYYLSRGRTARPTAVMLGCLALALPLWIVYRGRRVDFVSHTGWWWAAGLMAATALAVLLAVLPVRPALERSLALLAVVLLCFSSNWAFTVSNETATWFGLFSSGGVSGRSTYVVGAKLIDYLRKNGYQSVEVRFWFHGPGADHAWVSSIVSLYFFGLSEIGHRMPIVDDEVRARLHHLVPSELVLLCMSPTCGGAEEQLARSGFRYHRVNSTFIRAGKARLWVRVLEKTG